MGTSTTRAPAEAQNRLNRARLALRLAEERTGLRDSAALTVQRALSSASTSALLSASADSPPAASPAFPTALSAWQDSGVLTLHGSTTLLLAALALRQGATGWCGIIGGDELGWCAATEIGLDLNRVLTVPAPLLDDTSILTVTSTLLDGVDTLLIGATVAEGLRPQHRRRLLSRARERGHLILTPARWEDARILQAAPLAPDAGTKDTPPAQDPVEAPAEPSTDGVVIPIGRGTSPAPVRAIEMPAGYLRRLTWTLTDPQRPQLAATEDLTLSLSAEGLRTGSHNAVDSAPTPQEAAG
ncbi:hypothetical protein HMPREF2883_10070 [Actinomyces sp. HMSC075C01]|uniref:Protein ImuA n=1 Tax=Actinomyces oris TaxID=544580 RepID=A0A1Q8WWT4_9ACTO|nr:MULTISPECIES: hypothetical protein [Actinomyces]OFR48384.1 hypothetical protein HMPREF2883_10070 [Actinomyces sp. HMSC075C01]OLO51853.1 hypothetical protein BKH27_10855 [Actinomyces oris]OLO58868.1 hypothetical protein BKH24_09635 [Actinomyces oris]OLO72514.1 hypothetical protein BKH20_01485 [Actinomyces oris]